MGKKAQAAQQELDAYRKLVRDEAYRVAKEEGWCDDGLRRSLERLGLEPMQTFRIRCRAQRIDEFSMSVVADSEAEARQLLRDEPQRMRDFVGAGYASFEVVESDATPAAADAAPGAPQVGSPRPAEGTWYATSAAPGGPNQCRVWSEDHRVYCTRPAGHPVNVHVAAGNNAGVLDVWPAREGDQRGAEFSAENYGRDGYDDRDDTDED